MRYERLRREQRDGKGRTGLFGLRRTHLTRLAGATAMLLVLAACGGGDEDAADPVDEAADASESVEPEGAEPEGEESAEFPNVVDGVLQPLPDGFPSEAITLWQPFEPGSDDDVYNQFVAQVGAKYSPVEILTDTQQMGPATSYELSDYLLGRPGAEDGYHIHALSWFGVGTRLFTQEAMSDIPAQEMFDKLVPINVMTFAPYSFLAPIDGEFETIEDAEEYMAENPGDMVISSSSPGGGIHSSTLVWARQAGDFEFTYVPTDSPAEARQVLLGGGSDMATSRTEPGLDEQFKFLMVTGDTRLEVYPDVPAAGEFGYNIPSGTDRGYSAIPGVPQEHIDWLAEWLRLVNEDPEFLERYADLDLTYRGPEEVQEQRSVITEEFVPVLEEEGIVVRDDLPEG
ncbi:MAG: hypothetical protein GEU73_13630 [Chloroflexi bacterium]|nr:hypothetical protein [Chloroflexota bacterium]